KYTSVGLGLLVASTTGVVDAAFTQRTTEMQALPKATQSVAAPELVEPGWLKQKRAQAVAKGQKNSTTSARVVTYDVTTRGAVVANVAEFRALANATLNDSRGWARLGVSFK